MMPFTKEKKEIYRRNKLGHKDTHSFLNPKPNFLKGRIQKKIILLLHARKGLTYKSQTQTF